MTLLNNQSATGNDQQQTNENFSISEGTGSLSDFDFKFIKKKFGDFEITIKLTLDNKFIDVVALKVQKDFRSIEQKLSSISYHDVDEYYEK